MKQIWHIMKSMIINSCVWFTGLTLALFLIGSAFPSFGNAMALSSILSVLAFSLILAGAQYILKANKLPLWLRIGIHYATSLMAFYVLFLVIITKTTQARALLTDMILFTIFYGIFMGAWFILRHSLKNK